MALYDMFGWMDGMGIDDFIRGSIFLLWKPMMMDEVRYSSERSLPMEVYV